MENWASEACSRFESTAPEVDICALMQEECADMESNCTVKAEEDVQALNPEDNEANEINAREETIPSNNINIRQMEERLHELRQRLGKKCLSVMNCLNKLNAFDYLNLLQVWQIPFKMKRRQMFKNDFMNCDKV